MISTITSKTAELIARAQQRRSYRTGRALLHHCINAHSGKIDKKCQACAEIEKKTKAWQQKEAWCE